ncbi:MAG: hypothetical protein Q9217_002480 [Psora testacea]
MLRTQSRSSERARTPSISGSSLASPPQYSPEPAYIAYSAAAHVVKSELVNRGQNLLVGDGVDEVDDVLTISPSALSLINSFLDQLLFNFLASSRSTSILSLRPAISEILKPRLAKEAIEGADEELRGYLADGDDEELLDFHNGQELKAGSNLHQIFRRTRLRCMVYTRFGDMEEEDEEAYLEDSRPLEADNERRRLSSDLSNISPAAAIFLTSIIEFVGEQALTVASENAFNRVTSKKSSPGGSQRLAVDDRDVEKIAFNKTLGRLWRSWKKRGRTSSMLKPRTSSHDYHVQSKTTSRRASKATSVSEEDELSYFEDDPQRQPSVAQVLEEDRKSRGDAPSKVAELPAEPDFSTDTDGSEAAKEGRGRPRSMIDFVWPTRPALRGTAVQESGNSVLRAPRLDDGPGRIRQRSSSLPTIKSITYSSKVLEGSTTPAEEPDPFMNDVEERGKAVKDTPHLIDESGKLADVSLGNPAISTIDDGALKRHPRPTTIDPNLPSREVSMSEHSEQASTGYDTELTPQALNFRKSEFNETEAGPESGANIHTHSTSYSFQRGEQSPLVFTEDVVQEVDGKGIRTEDKAYLARSNSIDQPRAHLGNFADFMGVQGDRLESYDQSGRAVKRDIPAPYETPSNKDVSYDSEALKKIPLDYGALPTPTTTKGRDIGQARGTQQGEVPSSNVAQNQPTIAVAKFVDISETPTPLASGTERAGVQRVSPTSTTTRDPLASGGRTSTSSNRDGRPMTAGSSTSAMSTKIKGIIGREPGDIIRQPFPRTTSSEISREVASESPKSGKSYDKEQDFEQLIRSDETIQYTLTPQNMREMEKSDSPRWSTKPPPLGAAEVADSHRSAVPTGSGTEKSVAPARSIKSLRGLNGLRLDPTEGSNVTESASPSNVSPTTMKPCPQPPPKSPGGKARGIVARNATSQDGSLRDFADFIRSTGPENDPRTLANSTSNRPPVHAREGGNTSQQGRARPAAKKIIQQNPVVAPKKSDPTSPARTSSKLIARDPVAFSTNTSADLADFLRSGPPGAPLSQQSVSSPQRNGRIKHGTSSSTSQDSYAPSKVTQSSSNSRTGLLENMNKGPNVRNNTQRTRQDDPSGPMRKQRRVLDPYAIDSDEEDDAYGNSPGLEREEESLSDFLKNYTPPSTPTGRSRQAIQRSSSSQNADNTQRKGSGVSMRERLARNVAVIPDYRPLPPKASNKNSSKPLSVTNEKRQQRQHTNSATANIPPSNAQRGPAAKNAPQAATAPQLPTLKSVNAPRATSPHLISQNGNKIDTYRPTQPTYAKHVDRRPKQPLQARDETGTVGGGGGSGTADLADFLRETEPPTPSGPITIVAGATTPRIPTGKREGVWSGIFGRKKRSVA